MILRTIPYLLVLAPALCFDLARVKFPAGMNVQKMKNLMAVVDPKSCGCARPDQHCEVPVPEARYVGFTCKVGTFCCRFKRRPKPVSPIRRISEDLAPTVSPDPTTPTIKVTSPKPQPQTSPLPQTSLRPQIRQRPVTTATRRTTSGRPTTPSTSPIINADRKEPVFDPSVPERVVTKYNLKPHDLGLPKGIRAFIRPVSQITKRVLQVVEDSDDEFESPVCRCEPVNTCPAEKRDYITFRKSCPYGQVQCCREYGDTTGMDNLVNLPVLNAPVKLSAIRPVHLPLQLVPSTSTSTTTSTTTTTTTTTTATTTTTTTSSTTTTTIQPTPAQTTPPPVTLFSATPHTVVSSTYTVTKLEWETADIHGNFGEKIKNNPIIVVKNYDPSDINLIRSESPTTTTTTTTTSTETTSISSTDLPTSTRIIPPNNFPPRKPIIILPAKQIPQRQRIAPSPNTIHQQNLHSNQPLKVERWPGAQQAVPGLRPKIFSPQSQQWPRPFMVAPPPPSKLIDRADVVRPEELGFVESVGEIAINMAKTLLSWPF